MIQRIDAHLLKGQGDLFAAGHYIYFLGPMADGRRRLWRFTQTMGLPSQYIATTTLESPTDDQLLELLEEV